MAARAIQREHQLALQTLPQRIPSNERLELPHHRRVLSQRKLGFYAIFDRREPGLAKPGDLAPRERLIRKVSQWLPPP